MIKINYYKILTISFIFIFFVFLNYNYNATEMINIENQNVKKCAACHTLTGNSIAPIWPKIAGQHSDYLFKQLTEYKKGKEGNRFDPTMLGMIQNLNEKELKDLSDYFSKQTLEKTKIKKQPENFEKGKELYIYGDKKNNIAACIGCHGIDGLGNKLANFPVLKWQHKDYIITQLKKFKTKERLNDANEIMRDITINMSNDQMDALASYISFIE